MGYFLVKEATSCRHFESLIETEGLISMFNFLKNIYNSMAGGAGPQIEDPSGSKSRHISSDETENRVWLLDDLEQLGSKKDKLFAHFYH